MEELPGQWQLQQQLLACYGGLQCPGPVACRTLCRKVCPALLRMAEGFLLMLPLSQDTLADIQAGPRRSHRTSPHGVDLCRGQPASHHNLQAEQRCHITVLQVIDLVDIHGIHST